MIGALRSLGSPNRTLMGIVTRTPGPGVTFLCLTLEPAEVAPPLRRRHQILDRLDDTRDGTIPHIGGRRGILEDQHAGIGLEQRDPTGCVNAAIDPEEIQVQTPADLEKERAERRPPTCIEAFEDFPLLCFGFGGATGGMQQPSLTDDVMPEKNAVADHRNPRLAIEPIRTDKITEFSDIERLLAALQLGDLSAILGLIDAHHLKSAMRSGNADENGKGQPRLLRGRNDFVGRSARDANGLRYNQIGYTRERTRHLISRRAR